MKIIKMKKDHGYFEAIFKVWQEYQELQFGWSVEYVQERLCSLCLT